jgi:hypothetical protein
MKLTELIAHVDEIKPNAFDNDTKTRWVNQLEGRIQSEVFLWDVASLCVQYTYPETEEDDPELLVKAPYEEIYEHWLEARIDYANGEYDKYQNSMAMFEEVYHAFAAWFINTYHPAEHRGC